MIIPKLVFNNEWQRTRSGDGSFRPSASGRSSRQRSAIAAAKFLKYSSLKNVTIPETPIGLKDVTTKELSQKTMMVLDNTAVFGQVTIYYKNDYTCENVKLLWLFQLHSATKVIILNE